MSDDSYRYSNNLTEALDKILDEQGIFAIRKQISHEAKKLDPATSPAVSVSFEHASRKLNDDYARYKGEVDKIASLRKTYEKAAKVAFPSDNPILHQNAIDAATKWCEQAVKSGKQRITFLKVHKEELKTLFSIKSTVDHIKQCEANLNSANRATDRLVTHETHLMNLAKRAAADS